MTYEDSIHKVTLSGSEISSILYALEGWIQANDEYNEGGDLSLDIDNVFEALQEVADSWQGEFAEPKVTITPQELEGDISTITDDDYDTFSDKVVTCEELEEQSIKHYDDDYADKVDTLVGNMVASDDNVFTHDSEGC